MEDAILTVDKLKTMEPGTVFAKGEIDNSPEGLYMTNSQVGRKLVWVAKRGYANDWAIYAHWATNGYDYAESNGDKVVNPENVQKLVPCDPGALDHYRL